jgi:hypothetical protein
MIMTKERARENKRAIAVGLNNGTTAVPPDGEYKLTAIDELSELGQARGQDNYVVIGMVLPASRAMGLCQALQDDQGGLTSPVYLLSPKSTGSLARSDRMALSPDKPAGWEKPEYVPPNAALPDIKIRDIEIIPGRHEVRVKGKSVTLTFSEFRILHTLASHPGWVFDRTKIIYAVHGNDYSCTERAVDVQVTGLRKKLGPAAGACIQTVRGVGYRFVE